MSRQDLVQIAAEMFFPIAKAFSTVVEDLLEETTTAIRKSIQIFGINLNCSMAGYLLGME